MADSARNGSVGSQDGREGAEEVEAISGPETDQQNHPDCQGSSRFFDGGKFIPLRQASTIMANHTLAFGFDSETGGGRLMEYCEGVWRPAVGLDVEAQRLLGEDARSGRIKQTLDFLKRGVPRHPWDEWNNEPRLINCTSGMLDPATLELRPHAPECLSVFQIPVEWDPEAVDEHLAQFFGEVLPLDCVPLVAMIMGYLLVMDLSADKFFVLVGDGDSGKTTFLDAFLDMYGPSNWAQVSLHDLASNRFAAAGAENKPLVCFDDLDGQHLKSSSVIKALTGGHQWVRIERKGKDAYRSPLYARFLFTCNEIPCGPDKSGAWYRRICVLPFDHVIPKTRRDAEFGEKLETPAARQAMFAFAVWGLRLLMEGNWQFPEPPSVARVMRAYRARNDSVAAFVQDCCQLDPAYQMDRVLWYKAYNSWAEEAGLHPISRQKAYDQLREAYGCGFGQLHDGSRVVRGIRVAKPPVESLGPLAGEDIDAYHSGTDDAEEVSLSAGGTEGRVGD